MSACSVFPGSARFAEKTGEFPVINQTAVCVEPDKAGCAAVGKGKFCGQLAAAVSIKIGKAAAFQRILRAGQCDREPGNSQKLPAGGAVPQADTGLYIEERFPMFGVRYIAINDNVDTENAESNDLMPFKNLFNEWFIRDTSRKIRAVQKAKAERGERLGTRAPYGYVKDLETKKLIVDEEAAAIVKWIFALCAAGNGPSRIATILTKEKVLCPSYYTYQKYGLTHSALDITKPYHWSDSAVANLLEKQEFAEYLNSKQSAELQKEIRRLEKEKAAMQKRKAELDAIFKKLYEDSVLGRITAEQFQMLSASYTDEQAKLTEALPQREAEIQRLKETVSNTAAFLDKAKRYTDIQELTPELLRLFIQKIVVHEKEVKWSKHAPQTVEIHYADIGCMENRQTAKPEQHKDIPMVS